MAFPGTIEYQQDGMPPEAPQMLPQVSPTPMPMPQMLGTQISPYIQQAPDSPSVLNTPEINEALKQQTLAQIQALGNNSYDKRDKIRNIFTGIMAPAMAIFGGAGSAAAGADLVQQARQQAIIGKQQKMAERQQAAAALKGLVDIENTIRLKPIGQMMKAQNQAIGNQIKQQDLERKNRQGDRRLAIQENRNRIYENAQTRMGDLRSRGLDIKEAGLAQTKELAEKRDRTLRDIAVLNAQQRQGIADQNYQAKLTQLQQQWQTQNAQLSAGVEKFNQSTRATIDKYNSEAKAKGAEPLNADQYLLNFNGIDHVDTPEEPSDDDYRAALQQVMQPAQQQQAPAAAPQQAPAQTAQKQPSYKGKSLSPQTQQNLLMKVQQRYGMNFQQAADYLKANGLM